MKITALGALAAAALLGGCEPTPTAKPIDPSVNAPKKVATAPAPKASNAPAPKVRDVPGLTFDAPKRLVAFGDVHGDLDATKRALRLAGAIDASGAWIGGDLVVVQTGDQLDRGDDDRAILDLFDSLALQAREAGGRVLALNGNHELMNAQLDFRYVTEGSNPPFAEFAAAAPQGAALPEAQKGRAGAFFPGGVYAKKLAERPIVAIVGDSVFVHGGVLPKHVEYGLEKLDAETRAWLRGEAKAPPSGVVAEDGVVWSRLYSAAPGVEECTTLAKALAALGKKRMVMGHTPQKPDISSACGGAAWRIDTGMSRHYGGRVEVLQIVGDAVTVLKE